MIKCSMTHAGLADEALSALEAKAAEASAQAAELAELRDALAQREEQLAEHAAEAERLTLEVQALC
jgi:small-conductance mechanosensitive channel